VDYCCCCWCWPGTAGRPKRARTPRCGWRAGGRSGSKLSIIRAWLWWTPPMGKAVTTTDGPGLCRRQQRTKPGGGEQLKSDCFSVRCRRTPPPPPTQMAKAIALSSVSPPCGPCRCCIGGPCRYRAQDAGRLIWWLDSCRCLAITEKRQPALISPRDRRTQPVTTKASMRTSYSWVVLGGLCAHIPFQPHGGCPHVVFGRELRCRQIPARWTKRYFDLRAGSKRGRALSVWSGAALRHCPITHSGLATTYCIR